jgi:hypothetical protein
LAQITDQSASASDFRSRQSGQCIEDVRAEKLLSVALLGPTIERYPGFSEEKENRLDAYYLKRWLAHSLLKENRNKKGNKGNRVRLKDCGEWKLWGRHPLTIEKQAVALSGERS